LAIFLLDLFISLVISIAGLGLKLGLIPLGGNACILILTRNPGGISAKEEIIQALIDTGCSETVVCKTKVPSYMNTGCSDTGRIYD